jgi:hypothetical protein
VRHGNKNIIIAWWSGGITSAVTCKICIDVYGIDNVRIVFIDTKNEDEDTYRFKDDCEKWYGKAIERITNERYDSIVEVWERYLSLNVANGAICSSELKRDVRRKFSTHNQFAHQAFGFDIDETKRARSMKLNNEETKPIFPLLLYGYSKKDCIAIVQQAGIEVPRAYQYGLNNNNCLNTGCIQGGVGYWQKIKTLFPEKFEAMAQMEHNLTDKKGKPVTMLRSKSLPVFLKPHPGHPLISDISMMKGRPPKPLMECNGFCGSNDLSERNETEQELNYQ